MISEAVKEMASGGEVRVLVAVVAAQSTSLPGEMDRITRVSLCLGL